MNFIVSIVTAQVTHHNDTEVFAQYDGITLSIGCNYYFFK